ncbi:hypothetical protein SVIOM342S_03291 [Streptomyces violaceorubidus]
MDIFVTVIVLLAVIAAGAFRIHRLNALHGGRSAAFHYDRGGVVAPDRKTTDGKSAEGKTATAGKTTAGKTADGPVARRRDGGRGRLRPRRRIHGVHDVSAR